MLVKVPLSYDVIGKATADSQRYDWQRRDDAVIVNIEEVSAAQQYQTLVEFYPEVDKPCPGKHGLGQFNERRIPLIQVDGKWARPYTGKAGMQSQVTLQYYDGFKPDATQCRPDMTVHDLFMHYSSKRPRRVAGDKMKYVSPLSARNKDLGHFSATRLRDLEINPVLRNPKPGYRPLGEVVDDKSPFVKRNLHFLASQTTLYQGEIYLYYRSDAVLAYNLSISDNEELVLSALIEPAAKLGKNQSLQRVSRVTFEPEFLEEMLANTRRVWFNNPEEPVIIRQAYLDCPYTRAVLGEHPTLEPLMNDKAHPSINKPVAV